MINLFSAIQSEALYQLWKSRAGIEERLARCNCRKCFRYTPADLNVA